MKNIKIKALTFCNLFLFPGGVKAKSSTLPDLYTYSFFLGEKSPQLFPKPVYEEAPFDQREKVIQGMRDEFHKNVTNMVKVEKSMCFNEKYA